MRGARYARLDGVIRGEKILYALVRRYARWNNFMRV